MKSYLAHAPNIQELENIGYTVLTLSDELVSEILEVTRLGLNFFRKPLNEKLGNTIEPINHGYRPLGTEFSKTPDRPDLAEYFVASLSTNDKAKDLYTSEAIALHNKLISCKIKMTHVLDELTDSICKYLNIDGMQDLTLPCDIDSDYSLIYYQPKQHQRDLLQDPHEDGMYVSLLKSTAPGLEVLLSDGQYHQVSVSTNELLVVPGDLLGLMSGFRFKPLTHRVVRHNEQMERITLAYFAMPNIVEGKSIQPWISNELNADCDIISRSIYNRDQFLSDH